MRTPTRNETIIEKRRLDELERKERGHDDYLAAMQAMSRKQTKFLLQDKSLYGSGYLDAIADFAKAVLNASTESEQEAHEVTICHSDGPSAAASTPDILHRAVPTVRVRGG